MLKEEKQKTVGSEVHFSGKALQTGRETRLICKPAAANAGIVFIRTDLEDRPALRVNGSALAGGHARRSSLRFGKAEIQTVEHFLAALWGAGIDNVMAEIDGAELPAMDGSAKGFLDPLKKAGVAEQEDPRRVIKIAEEERIELDGRSLVVFPADDFSVSYLIDYNIPSIGREEFSMVIDEESFEREIAPARTFCLKAEADALLRMGMGKGADLDNTLVMDDGGPVGTVSRFENEPVRHKVLDLIGDLYMLGCPVTGRFVAEKSGHDLNALMVRRIYEKYVKEGEQNER